MAIDKKIFVGGLDTDSDYRLVKNEDYVEDSAIKKFKIKNDYIRSVIREENED